MYFKAVWHRIGSFIVTCLAAGMLPAPVVAAPETFSLPFDRGEERVYFDRPIETKDTPLLILTFETQDPDPLSALSIHLLHDDVWGTYQPTIEPLGGARYQATCPRAAFVAPDGSSFDWTDATTIRFSFWRHARTAPKEVRLLAIDFRSAEVALLTFDAQAFTQQCAHRVQRILTRCGILSATVRSGEDLSRYPLVIVPYCAALSGDQQKELNAIVRRGGKLILFYLHAPALAEVLGMEPQLYVAAPEGKPWRMMTCGSGLKVFAPTTNIIPVTPRKGRPFATWEDGRAACTLTDKGAWFAYLPPLASVEAVEMFSQILSQLTPQLQRAPVTADPALATAPFPAVPRKGVWFSESTSGVAGGWDACFAQLAQAKVTDAFVNLQIGSKVFFPIRGREVHTANVPSAQEDSLPALIAAGKKHHIKVHAWIICWSANESDKSMKRFSERHTAVVADGIKALQFRGVQGIHLDYVRYPDATTAAHDPMAANKVTRFVKALRQVVTGEFTAAVFPTPASAATLAQDWPAWLEDKAVDAVCPMMYADHVAGFTTYCQAIKRSGVPMDKVLAGLGYAADESQLDRGSLILQTRVAVEQGLGGVVFFAFDENLPPKIR